MNSTEIHEENFNFQHALALILDVAKKAGQEVLKVRSSSALDIEVKSDHFSNIVTAGDRVSEAMIVAAIRLAYPNHSLRGEEGTEEKGTSDFEWIIDPIDGTINYSHGSESFGISIGLLQHGVPVLGVIYFPALQKMMHGIRGAGAYIDDQQIRVKPIAGELKDAVINFDFSANGKRSEEATRFLAPLADVVRYPKIEASYVKAVFDVVRGVSDGYVHPAATPYDVAAAYVIAKEAGCVISGIHKPIDFTEKNLSTIIANSKYLQERLLQIFS